MYLWFDIFKIISIIDNENKVYELFNYFQSKAGFALKLKADKSSEYYYKIVYKTFETAIHNYFFSKYTNNVVKTYLKK